MHLAGWGLLAREELMRLQFLLGDFKLRSEVLLEQLSEVANEDEFVLPQLHQTLQHVNYVVVFDLCATKSSISQAIR